MLLWLVGFRHGAQLALAGRYQRLPAPVLALAAVNRPVSILLDLENQASELEIAQCNDQWLKVKGYLRAAEWVRPDNGNVDGVVHNRAVRIRDPALCSPGITFPDALEAELEDEEEGGGYPRVSTRGHGKLRPGSMAGGRRLKARVFETRYLGSGSRICGYVS